MNEWLAARNILAVRLDNIGDVIMLGPALRAVKETSPQARLTLLASPGGASAAALLPWIDEVIIWRPIWQDVGNHMPFDPQREWQFIQQLAGNKFDAALIFTSFSQTPYPPAYVCYLAGIPLRAGESTEFGGSTLSTEYKGTPVEINQAERNLRLVERLGFFARNRQLAIALSTKHRQAATALLHEQGIDLDQPFILIHPGASAKARRYASERYGDVAKLLVHNGWQVVVTGVEREEPEVAIIREHAPEAHYLVAATNLPEYAALVERAALVICNNSLPLHLADALHTPLIVLYSGTDYEEQWGPRAALARLLRRPTACHPCYLFECPIGLACLDIAPEDVAAAAADMLLMRKNQQPRIVSAEEDQ